MIPVSNKTHEIIMGLRGKHSCDDYLLALAEFVKENKVDVFDESSAKVLTLPKRLEYSIKTTKAIEKSCKTMFAEVDNKVDILGAQQSNMMEMLEQILMGAMNSSSSATTIHSQHSAESEELSELRRRLAMYEEKGHDMRAAIEKECNEKFITWLFKILGPTGTISVRDPSSGDKQMSVEWIPKQLRSAMELFPTDLTIPFDPKWKQRILNRS